MWVPVLFGPLKNLIALMLPSTCVLNRRPSVTAFLSVESSIVGTVSSSKSVQGHTPGVAGGLAVRKLQILPVETACPRVSVPVTVAV